MKLFDERLSFPGPGSVLEFYRHQKTDLGVMGYIPDISITSQTELIKINIDNIQQQLNNKKILPQLIEEVNKIFINKNSHH